MAPGSVLALPLYICLVNLLAKACIAKSRVYRPSCIRKTPALQNLMSTKLYVGNLSFDVSENDLQDAFSQHGPVAEVHLVTDKISQRPRGFAFVTMETKEGADAAIKALNGSEWHGRKLTVNEARPREDRPRDDRRGGGGGGGRSRY